jgi:hypothetical protein
MPWTSDQPAVEGDARGTSYSARTEDGQTAHACDIVPWQMCRVNSEKRLLTSLVDRDRCTVFSPCRDGRRESVVVQLASHTSARTSACTARDGASGGSGLVVGGHERPSAILRMPHCLPFWPLTSGLWPLMSGQRWRVVATVACRTPPESSSCRRPRASRAWRSCRRRSPRCPPWSCTRWCTSRCRRRGRPAARIRPRRASA